MRFSRHQIATGFAGSLLFLSLLLLFLVFGLLFLFGDNSLANKRSNRRTKRDDELSSSRTTPPHFACAGEVLIIKNGSNQCSKLPKRLDVSLSTGQKMWKAHRAHYAASIDRPYIHFYSFTRLREEITVLRYLIQFIPIRMYPRAPIKADSNEQNPC